MAVVILGGLVSSTLLNLLVMPVVAARYHAERAPSRLISPARAVS
jgi:Cu/Ag efflux pump CusA